MQDSSSQSFYAPNTRHVGGQSPPHSQGKDGHGSSSCVAAIHASYQAWIAQRTMRDWATPDCSDSSARRRALRSSMVNVIFFICTTPFCCCTYYTILIITCQYTRPQYYFWKNSSKSCFRLSSISSWVGISSDVQSLRTLDALRAPHRAAQTATAARCTLLQKSLSRWSQT